jgi:2-oxoisovalerate dehydrogenase E1 component alpha subunit
MIVRVASAVCKAASRHPVFASFATDATVAYESPAFGVFPGGKRISYTEKLDTHPPELNAVMPCFRIMDENGSIRPGAVDPDVGRDTALRIYTTMVRLQTMDTIFYDAQRQGRVSFYMTNGTKLDWINSVALIFWGG